MKKTLLLSVGILVGCASSLTSQESSDVFEHPFTEREQRRIASMSFLKPPPGDPTNAYSENAEAARLGQYLFFDPALSGSGKISCATCHDPDKGFADAKPLAEGHLVGGRNSPSLWNAAYQRWYFWDGRADSLWAQAIGPIENLMEMNGSRSRTTRHVLADESLKRAYESVFGPLPSILVFEDLPEDASPVPIAPEDPRHRAWIAMEPDVRDAMTQVVVNVAKAIAAYERLLVSRRSPFDIFAEGLREGDTHKQDAISPAAKRGLRIFIGRGDCRLCHSGPNLSDGEFHDILIAPRPELDRDPGRYVGIHRVLEDPFNASGPYSDERDGEPVFRLRTLRRNPATWGEVKTPSLRNVALTAPYMHQGQKATLRDVVHHYSTFEGARSPGHHAETFLSPLELTESEIDDLVAFLETLTDQDLPRELFTQPPSPSAD